MAKADRTNSEIDLNERLPEERLAARLVLKRKLVPPVPIRELLLQYAKIEYDRLPAECDAILLRRQTKNKRPLVIVDETKPETRVRFTLAHELGHIVIPWHIGQVGCHTSYSEDGQSLYYVTEAEANRFAAELLLPTKWMKQVISACDSFDDILDTIQSANVSVVAAAISLCKALPSGYVFVAVDSKGKIVASGKSAKTVAPAMDHQRFDPSYYDGTGAKLTKLVASRTTVHWWEFPRAEENDFSDDLRTSREILTTILEESLKPSDRQSVLHSINGIIGGANSSHKPSTAIQLIDLVRQRFGSRGSLVLACAKHPEFEVFIHKRAEEIMAKRDGG